MSREGGEGGKEIIKRKYFTQTKPGEMFPRVDDHGESHMKERKRESGKRRKAKTPEEPLRKSVTVPRKDKQKCPREWEQTRTRTRIIL